MNLEYQKIMIHKNSILLLKARTASINEEHSDYAAKWTNQFLCFFGRKV